MTSSKQSSTRTEYLILSKQHLWVVFDPRSGASFLLIDSMTYDQNKTLFAIYYEIRKVERLVICFCV